jgi:hypothetical protein
LKSNNQTLNKNQRQMLLDQLDLVLTKGFGENWIKSDLDFNTIKKTIDDLVVKLGNNQRFVILGTQAIKN